MRNAVDAVLEASVVGSFTKLGPWVRRRLYHWDAEPVATMQGRTVVISGATSGLGRECARALVRAGASLDIIARNASKAAELRAELQPLASAGASIDVVIADTGDLPAMRAAAATLASRHATIDVLIHNAGALDATFGLSPDGIEQTLASHVIGPLAMTELLVPQLRAAGTLASPARLLWVSSGGMYVEPLDVAT
ncbi:MAG TPA: SDR family NAD(P)-dependent oxidoreductase, partial [Kofleriaceae bacterium]|nr:SDR family NAD(P)-dependent oxidoreductase [Kofleriaceae bacterium]